MSNEHSGILLPQDWELIGFFEVEPTLAYEHEPDLGWQYNTLTFETQRGSDLIWFEMSPSYGEIKLRWLRDDAKVIELALCYAERLTVENERGREYMRVDFEEGKMLLPFVIQLKPTVSIEWGVTRWV